MLLCYLLLNRIYYFRLYCSPSDNGWCCLCLGEGAAGWSKLLDHFWVLKAALLLLAAGAAAAAVVTDSCWKLPSWVSGVEPGRLGPAPEPGREPVLLQHVSLHGTSFYIGVKIAKPKCYPLHCL